MSAESSNAVNTASSSQWPQPKGPMMSGEILSLPTAKSRNDPRAYLHALKAGVAVIDKSDWRVLYENPAFTTWFPPASDPVAARNQVLTDRMPDLKASRAQERLERGRAYKFETEVCPDARCTAVSVELREGPDQGDGTILVECHDISKQKEANYMLDSYSRMAEKNARELTRERDRVERLLLNVMPRAVYEELKEYGTTTPHRFENVSILMLDFARFTDMAVSHDPGALVAELNDIFTAFDRIVENFGCERIRTIGDAYMAVSGVPEAGPDHAQNIAKVALRMRRYIERRNETSTEEWRCRIGINAGPVIGSLVGVQKYVYDLFGPGANLAARMESLAEPMTITLCKETYELLKDDFVFTELGEADVKGFGKRLLYRLEDEARDLRR